MRSQFSGVLALRHVHASREDVPAQLAGRALGFRQPLLVHVAQEQLGAAALKVRHVHGGSSGCVRYRASPNQGDLSSPLGIALAPSSLGGLVGDLLVGNFGGG